MSQDKIRLLEHLVYSQFGDAIGEIASILLTRGSLSFDHIRRLSALPPKTIYASLAILSLHSLLYHSDPSKTSVLFEMNERAIEERSRIGKYATLAEKWMKSLIPKEVESSNGSSSSSSLASTSSLSSRGTILEGLKGLDSGRAMGLVIKRLMVEGFVGEEELIQVLSDELYASGFIIVPKVEGGREGKKLKGKGKVVSKSNEDDSNGLEENYAAFNLLAKQILQHALYSNIISVVTSESQYSPSSLEIKWLGELRSEIKGAPTTKDVAEMKEGVVEMKHQFSINQRALAAGLDAPARKDDDGPPRKKSRMSQIKLDGEENIGTPLPTEAFYRINSEKLHIRWRNELMCEFVADRYSPIIAAVFGVILNIAEPDIDTLEQRSSNSISSHEIFSRVKSASPSIDLFETYAPPPKPTKDFTSTTWKPPKEASTILHEICNDLADRRDNEPPLEAPLGQSKEFLSAVGSGGPGGMRWRVEFGHCGARMKRMLVEAMVLDKVGNVGVRCWRIIDGKGKIDEKHLATLALLPVKESREILGHLSSNSLIECQEVPRSADRAPSRTFFLWYVNYPKVIQTLLDHQFKALANLQAQRTFQVEKRASLVAKRERSDVKENREELLTFREKEALDELDRILEALATAEQRIDRDIFVLRDMDKDF